MSAVDVNQINCATFTPINSKIDIESIISRQDQENEPTPSSQTIYQKLAKIEDNVDFLEQLFKEIETISHNNCQLKQLIHHPLIRFRCYSLSSRDVTDDECIFSDFFDTFETTILDIFLNFLEKNPNLQPDLECFISQQLVQLQLSLKCYSDKLGEFIVKFNSSKAIQQPLKAIFDRSRAKKFSSVQERQPLNLKEYHTGYFDSLSVKESAVRVAHTLDGTDFRSGGLRVWVHQPPRGKEGRATDLIIKNIQEFDSGRRDFIFKASSLEDVPLQNYKIVMLYILRCLKEDRAAYYSKYSDYLPDAIFEQITERLQLNHKVDVTIDTQGQISLSDQDGAATLLLKENGFLRVRQRKNRVPFCEYERFQFEWAARKLIGLEERVKAVDSDQEILSCLNDFQEIYRELPNFNMDLTICTCISEYVFALPASQSDYKQAIHRHLSAVPYLISNIPSNLIELAKDAGVINIEQEKTDPVFEKLSQLRCFPKEPQELLADLEKLYSEAKFEDEQWIKTFLDISSKLPQGEAHLYTVNLEKLRNQLKDKSTILQNLKTNLIPNTFECTTNDAVNSALQEIKLPLLTASNEGRLLNQECLIPLQNQMIKSLKGHRVPGNHPIRVVFNKLNQLLQQLNCSLSKVDFTAVKACYEMLWAAPIPGLAEKIHGFNKALMSKNFNSVGSIKELCASLKDFKAFIKEEMLKFTSYTIHDDLLPVIYAALIRIDQIEVELADRALKIDKFSPDVFDLIIEIAKNQGFLKKDTTWTPSSLKEALEAIQKEILMGYKNLRKQILNNPQLLDSLQKKGITLDEKVQRIQGGLNSGLAGLLQQLVPISHPEAALEGLATVNTKVLGRVRIMQPEDQVPAKKGDILVMEHIAPDVHKYSEASAIISAQGGIFSHAAITFDELKIPALLGCESKHFKSLEGELILLNLSKTLSFTIVPQDVSPILNEIEQPNPQIDLEIDQLSDDLQSAIRPLLYHSVFTGLSVQEIAKFTHAAAFLEKELEASNKLEKRFYRSINSVEKAYLFNVLRRQLGRWIQLADIVKPTLVAELRQKELTLLKDYKELVSPLLNNSHKKNNLDKLQQVIPSLSVTGLTFEIPKYTYFTSQDLVWLKYPDMKKSVLKLLDSTLENREKSQEILKLLSQVLWQELNINWQVPCIVRSASQLEDQSQSAAAGIFKSVVVKDQKEIPQAFLVVLASAFSEKALAFYQQQNITNKEAILDINWILQDYISDAAFSGVAFSVADKKNWAVTGMQLVKGLGGGVDGQEIPAQLFIDTHENVLANLHLKKGESLPCEIVVAKAISALVKDLETHFKTPVEIEFVCKGNHLSIVQMRPITKSLI